MQSLEKTSGDLEQLPCLALGNDFLETNAGEFSEVTATARGVAAIVGSYGNCLEAILEFSCHRRRNNFGTYWHNSGIFIAA